jgi:DNA-binding transcriptional MerR regulator
MPATPAMLAIGDFSRATLLTIKTLRHYHDTGLLEAAEVDPHTGYRRYLTNQIPKAQMIKRFRELRMPLNEIRQLLASPDGSTRNTIIAAHLRRLENDLGRTRSAVSELHALLGPPAGPVTISHRHIAPMLAAAIGECVDAKHARGWRARWQSCIRRSLPRADEPSPQRADSSRTSSSPKGEVRQRSTFPVMGPLKVSVAYDPTNRLRSSLPQSYTQARIEVLI